MLFSSALARLSLSFGLFTGSFSVFALPAAWAQNTQSAQNTSISATFSLAVLPFENLTRQPADEWMGLSFAESLTGSLAQIPSVQVIERSQIKRLLQEQNFGQSALVDSSQAPSLGKLVGAKQMVVGNYQKVGERLRIQARVIQVETGQVLPNSVVQIEGGVQEILSLQDQLAQKLLSSFQLATPASVLATRPAQESEVRSLYYRGIYLLEKGTAPAREEAEGLFQNALRLNAQDAPAQSGLAQIYLIRSRINKEPQLLNTALHWADSAIQADIRWLKGWQFKAEIQQALGLKAESEATVKQALKLFPGNTELILSYVESLDIQLRTTMPYSELKPLLERLGADFNAPHILLCMGTHLLYSLWEEYEPDYSEVLAILLKARQGLPEQPIIPLHLSSIYLSMNQPEVALSHAEQGIELDPASEWVQILGHSNLDNIASHYRQAEQESQAVALFEKALQLTIKLIAQNPENGYYYLMKGQDLEHLGKNEEAMQAFLTAQKVSPDHPNVYTNLARLHNKQKNWQAAIANLEKAVELAANSRYQNMSEYLNYELGRTLVKANQKERAIPIFEKLRTGSTNYRETAIHQLLQIYQAEQNLPQIRDLYLQLFELQPKLAKESFYKLDYQRIYLQLELQKQPNSAALNNDLGQLFTLMGAPEKALDYFQKALKLEPDNPVVLYNLGSHFLRENMPTQAIPPLEKAVKNKPGYVNAAYNLGLSYLALNQKAQAKALFEQILSWQPGHAGASEALKSHFP